MHVRRRSPGPRPCPAALFPTLLLAALLSPALACSSGGGGDAAGAPTITSTATTFAMQDEAYAYDVDATDPDVADVLGFALTAQPTGMTIDPVSGLIGWTPTVGQLGDSAVTVRVTDSTGRTAEQSFTITVDPEFTTTRATSGPVTALLPETVTVAGGLAPYTVAFTTNASGGLVSVTGSTVTYTAGATAGSDVFEVTDARGRVEELTIVVVPDPFAEFTARYGTTDNWMLQFDAKRFTSMHTYDTDLHNELVRLGLRTNGATGDGGTHDQLAVSLVTHRILSYVAQFYGNDADGTPSTLPISVFAETPATGSAPAVAQSVLGGPELYNVMEFSTQDDDSVLGRAFLDSSNASIEYNGGTSTFSGQRLGVDISDCTDFYLSSHPTHVLVPAVEAADVAGLESLLAGNAPVGLRETAIDDLVDHYAYRIAIETAHQIGHSLGLSHNGTSGSLMFAVTSFADGISPAFLASELTTLTSDLPGPGRAPSRLGWEQGERGATEGALERCERLPRATGP